ncbi:hypothetical protein GIB67_024015 [Kingdonia uniflora]|uniref:Uncharacterized protein n=1 Tax=Kingdonia uniflora TaxID=39325 RepID=A0A7J7NK96_9MAGN|nr:hypothetical protein GIB67_024015 [Kingdonia uniflora]
MVAVFNKELLSWCQESPTPTGNLSLVSAQQQADPWKNSVEVGSDNDDAKSICSDYEWVISIRDKLEQARQDELFGSWSKLSIYRIPKCLQESDDKSYVPQIVSLGPYHYGKKRLREMDRHKWRPLNQVLKRTKQDVRIYFNSMKELEEKARACYEGTITLSSNEFVEMMVLNGCFVLELFRGAAGGFKELGYSRNDPHVCDAKSHAF